MFKEQKQLTVIANDTAFPDKGIGKLVVDGRLKKVIVSHIGTNPETGRQMNTGKIEVELVPQGTLAERVRAGGAGLGGILTPTGIGTMVAEGKEVITVDGKEFLLEKPLRADVALIKAYQADTAGNLLFRRSARNFNPLMAMAAKVVIVEAENIVEAGQIDPDQVMTPGIFVDWIVQG
nr:3-oxoacid CoA-transferase subunit A [Anaerospora hongkongensis]